MKLGIFYHYYLKIAGSSRIYLIHQILKIEFIYFKEMGKIIPTGSIPGCLTHDNYLTTKEIFLICCTDDQTLQRIEISSNFIQWFSFYWDGNMLRTQEICYLIFRITGIFWSGYLIGGHDTDSKGNLILIRIQIWKMNEKMIPEPKSKIIQIRIQQLFK